MTAACILFTLAALMTVLGLLVAARARSGPQSSFASLLIAIGILMAFVGAAFARDRDGRYAQSPLKPWFDSLRSGKGPCCSDADGYAISDADWDVSAGRYRVRIPRSNDEADRNIMVWVDVPEDAVITEPNRAGRTMVWPIWGYQGPTIRCFMPGSMT
jgi:hypothetical protein